MGPKRNNKSGGALSAKRSWEGTLRGGVPLQEAVGYLYALTTVPNKKGNWSRADLWDNLQKLKKNKLVKKIQHWQFERKKNGTLHSHGKIWFKYPLKYNPRCKGWSWYFKPIPTKEDAHWWECYCAKHAERDLREQFDVYRFSD